MVVFIPHFARCDEATTYPTFVNNPSRCQLGFGRVDICRRTPMCALCVIRAFVATACKHLPILSNRIIHQFYSNLPSLLTVLFSKYVSESESGVRRFDCAHQAAIVTRRHALRSATLMAPGVWRALACAALLVLSLCVHGVRAQCSPGCVAFFVCLMGVAYEFPLCDHTPYLLSRTSRCSRQFRIIILKHSDT